MSSNPAANRKSFTVSTEAACPAPLSLQLAVHAGVDGDCSPRNRSSFRAHQQERLQVSAVACTDASACVAAVP